jgi:hypothetical protein
MSDSDADAELSEEEEVSAESVDINAVERWILEGNELLYECRDLAGTHVIVERAELVDGGKRWRLLCDCERNNPPPWDETCMHCGGEGCEECECEECDRPMRHINGVNYGCEKHPVV